MRKIISFYRAAERKGRKITKSNSETAKGYPLSFHRIFLKKIHASMFRRILENQLKVHDDHRKDYVMVIESTLNALNRFKYKGDANFTIHIFEIYYFEQIIGFELEMYGNNYTMLDMLIIQQIMDIINSFKENHEEILAQFSAKKVEEKIEIMTTINNY